MTPNANTATSVNVVFMAKKYFSQAWKRERPVSHFIFWALGPWQKQVCFIRNSTQVFTPELLSLNFLRETNFVECCAEVDDLLEKFGMAQVRVPRHKHIDLKITLTKNHAVNLSPNAFLHMVKNDQKLRYNCNGCSCHRRQQFTDGRAFKFFWRQRTHSPKRCQELLQF